MTNQIRIHKPDLYSQRLRQAIAVGMVKIHDYQNTARILAPPDPADLTEDGWLAILQAATEMRQELEELGYQVSG